MKFTALIKYAAMASIIFPASTGLLACGNEHRPPLMPDDAVSTREVARKEPSAVTPPATETMGVVNIAPGVASRCGIVETAATPKFDFDSAALRPVGRDALDTLARCMVNGALKGERLSLVGHADPRGEDDYNMALGTYRAQSVASYLQASGVPSARLLPSSRGELDAQGADSTSWALDRRVDIDVAPGS